MKPIDVQGSCPCGGVRYAIAGPIASPENCHCGMCRKAHGAAFEIYPGHEPGGAA